MTTLTDPAKLVQEYWRLMATNDFQSVSAVLSEDFVLEWPQSNERIRGIKNFVAMNVEYPAAGRWQFIINRFIVTTDCVDSTACEVVTDVRISDGQRQDQAVSFFTVRYGKIVHLVEYWPAPYAAPENRRHLVESMN